ETKVNGATDVIINISGDITLTDASDASEYVRQLAGDDVNVIFGAMYDESKTDTCTVTVIATGIDDKSKGAPKAAAPAQQTIAGAASAQAVQNFAQREVNIPVANVVTPNVAADTVSTVNISRPTNIQNLTLNKPAEVKPTVEPKSLKIPDFLQRK
ncbi:MAG: cell division protein FtsZ, partial [Butyrivibrio sp.]|nr:cell division protein FtsZ [Butyrivibrio sp.]